MKTLLFALLFGGGLIAQTPSYVPTNRLVGWWPFNGNANDASGNGNNGFVSGPTLTTDRFGNSSKAYSFNGIQDFIRTTSNITNIDTLTISTWVYLNSNDGGCYVHIGIDGNAGCNGIGVGSGGQNNYAFPGLELISLQSCIGWSQSTYQVNSQNWFNLVFVKTRNTAKYYLNGNLLGTSNLLNTNSPSSSIFFGSTADSPFTVTFSGKLDDIGIWNRALTQQEITALYQSSPISNGQTICSTIGQDSTALLNNGYITGNNPCGQNIHTENKWIDITGADSLKVYTLQHRLYDKSRIYDRNNQLIWEWAGENSSATWYDRNHSVFVGGNDSVKIEFYQGYADPFCNGLIQVTKMICGNNCVASITPQSSTTLCSGGSVVLKASTGTNYTYQWYNNSVAISNTNSSLYTATLAGNYTVKVMDGVCNATSSSTTVVVNANPSNAVNVSGNTTFCSGNSITLTAQGTGTYLWSNGLNTNSIIVTQTGNYNVVVTSNGCSSTSSATTVTVNQTPTASIVPSGNTTFCQGGTVTLTANGGVTYLWNNTSISQGISATQSGTYSVTVSSNGCSSTASKVVTVNPNPTVTLTSLPSFNNYYASPITLNGTPTGGTYSGAGVTGNSFNPTTARLGTKTLNYNYTNGNNCSGLASTSTIVYDTTGSVCTSYVTVYDSVSVTDTLLIDVNFAGIGQTPTITTIKVYPNPTSDVIMINTGDFSSLIGYSIKIVNTAGQTVYTSAINQQLLSISTTQFGANGFVSNTNTSCE